MKDFKNNRLKKKEQQVTFPEHLCVLLLKTTLRSRADLTTTILQVQKQDEVACLNLHASKWTQIQVAWRVSLRLAAPPRSDVKPSEQHQHIVRAQ